MTTTAYQELDHRTADGIDVTLLWSPETNRVLVAVCDAKTGDEFELTVAPGERALDVFHHPYAYHAARAGGSGTRQYAHT
jgi:hypothetical protein